MCVLVTIGCIGCVTSFCMGSGASHGTTTLLLTSVLSMHAWCANNRYLVVAVTATCTCRIAATRLMTESLPAPLGPVTVMQTAVPTAAAQTALL